MTRHGINNKIFAYGGFEVQFHAYVTYALASDHRATPGTGRPTEDLEKETRCLCWELNTDCSVVQHIRLPQNTH
jgi:hypothetical protein